MSKYLWLVVMFCASVAFSQPREEEEWNLDSLQYNPEEFESDFELDISTGWFPRLYSEDIFLWNVYFNTGNLWSDALIKNHLELGKAVNQWEAYFDLTYEERSMREKYSKDLNDNKPYTGFSEFGLGVIFPFLNAVYLNANAAFYWQTDILADVYKTKEYRTNDNQIKNFKEANIIELYEHGLDYSLDMKIPIYGASAFMSQHIASFYYITAGIGGKYLFNSEAMQYLQIATEKDKISFANGYDTLVVMQNRTLNAVEYSKYNINLGVGMITIADTFNIGFDVLYSFPVVDALKDAYWRQHIGKLSIYIGF